MKYLKQKSKQKHTHLGWLMHVLYEQNYLYLNSLAPWWSGFAGGKRTGACARTERERAAEVRFSRVICVLWRFVSDCDEGNSPVKIKVSLC